MDCSRLVVHVEHLSELCSRFFYVGGWGGEGEREWQMSRQLFTPASAQDITSRNDQNTCGRLNYQ